jgi:hypothetical protein
MMAGGVERLPPNIGDDAAAVVGKDDLGNRWFQTSLP